MTLQSPRNIIIEQFPSQTSIHCTRWYLRTFSKNLSKDWVWMTNAASMDRVLTYCVEGAGLLKISKENVQCNRCEFRGTSLTVARVSSDTSMTSGCDNITAGFIYMYMYVECRCQWLLQLSEVKCIADTRQDLVEHSQVFALSLRINLHVYMYNVYVCMPGRRCQIATPVIEMQFTCFLFHKNVWKWFSSVCDWNHFVQRKMTKRLKRVTKQPFLSD